MISIIICSIDPEKFAAVSRNYAALLGHEEFEIIGIHDARSLCEGYNRGIAQSIGSILVFSHDDIEILSPDFCSKLKLHLQDHDMIGVAGTSRVIHGQWLAAGQPFVHGHIAYFDPLKQEYTVNVFGADSVVVPDIQALDGLFFAMKRELALGLKFDQERFDGFHFYDMDFSYSAYLAGYRLAVCNDISIVHASHGNFDAAWHTYHARFLEKHRATMMPAQPLKMRCGVARFKSRQMLLEWCSIANLVQISQRIRAYLNFFLAFAVGI